MIDKMKEKESLEFMKNNSLGRLGCVLENGVPYVIPVVYLVEDEYVYIHSLPGQKVTAMRNNPNICLQIDRITDDGFQWQSVIAFGEFEEIENRDVKTKILYRYFEKFPRFTPVEAKFDVDNSLKNVVVFRIKNLRLTGVSENY